MKFRPFTHAALVLALAAAVSACSRPTEEIGPAQKAGAAIDNAGAQVAEGIHDKLDKADAAAKQVAEKARATGQEIENATAEATEDASRGVSKATETVGKKVEQAGENIQEAARK